MLAQLHQESDLLCGYRFRFRQRQVEESFAGLEKTSLRKHCVGLQSVFICVRCVLFLAAFLIHVMLATFIQFFYPIQNPGGGYL